MGVVNLSILIIGGDESQRRKSALRISSEDSSKFDTIILDAKESGGIGDIKKLSSQIHQRPYESTLKSFVITEAQNLTIEAQNALLKVLEEPPQSSRFILTAPTSEGLLSTVSSRCQITHLKSKLDVEINIEPIKSFFLKSAMEKYKFTDQLDLDLLQVFWRRELLSKFGIKKSAAINNIGVQRIVNYIKLINKFKNLKRKKVSQKIIKTLLILEAPKIQY